MTIHYIPHQSPVFTKQGEGRNGSAPLAGKARERADHYGEITDQVIAGAQPDISSGDDKGNKWLKAQIGVLSKHGYLAEEAGAYYVEKRKERTLGYNPIPHYYIHDKKELADALSNEHVAHVRVAGDRHQLLKTRKRFGLEKQIDSANSTIVIPGDLYAMKEMLYIIDQKIKGKLLDHPLIIENTVDAFGEGY